MFADNGRMSLIILSLFTSVFMSVVCAWYSHSWARPESGAASKLIPALKLTQSHCYWGGSETIVSMDGMRLENKGRMHFIVVASRPTWDVTIYRDDDKVYIKESLKEFESTGLVSEFLVTKQARKFDGVGEKFTAKIGDLEVSEVRGPKEQFAYLPLGKLAAPEVERILYTVFKQSTDGGIPIKYARTQKGVDWLTGLKRSGQLRNVLYTSGLQKVKVNKEIFEAPVGYKRAASVQEVLMSKVSRDASGDMDEIFEIGGKNRSAKPR